MTNIRTLQPPLIADCVSGHRLEFVPERAEKTSYQRSEDHRWFGVGTRELLRETTRYNCFGLALGARRGWLQDSADTNIIAALNADGFAAISSPTKLIIGDIVLYSRGQQIDHIAVFTGLHVTLTDNRFGRDPRGQDMLFVSKFGNAGEYRHALYDVPGTYGVPSQFWTYSP